MARAETAPSPTRRRRNKDAARARGDRSGRLSGPELPEGVLPDGEDWHPQTRALWDALRRSPLLADEPELGWMFLVDTCSCTTTMWTKGKWEFASEVRLRLAKFGATPEDRARLRVKVVTPEKSTAPPSRPRRTPRRAAGRCASRTGPEPMPWRGPGYPGEFPSLGEQVVEWIEHYLCHGPGDVMGEPIELDDEFYEFVVRAYRLDPDTGQRVYRRAFL